MQQLQMHHDEKVHQSHSIPSEHFSLTIILRSYTVPSDLGIKHTESNQAKRKKEKAHLHKVDLI
jgi:hypothetical protein